MKSFRKRFPATLKMRGMPPDKPKKTIIHRTRTGCYTCRTRRRKCDEARPECANCVRLGFKCEGYGVKLRWANDAKEHESAAKGIDSHRTTKRALVPKAAIGSPALPGNLQFRSSFPLGSDGRDSLLLRHFVTEISASLAPFVDDVTGDLWLHPFLRPAIMSLAAANLHQLHLMNQGFPSGDSTPSSNPQMTTISFYKQQAISLYATAVKTLSNASLEGSDAVGLYLTAVLLLSLFEWDFGSAGSYFTHLDGADTIVCLGFENIISLLWGPLILRSWAILRHTKFTRQLPFRPLEREKFSETDRKTSQLSSRVLDGTGNLQALLTDAFALRNRLVLQICSEKQGIEDHCTLQYWRLWYSKVFGFPYASEVQGHHLTEMHMSQILDSLYQNEVQLRVWREALPRIAEPTIPHMPSNSNIDCRGGFSPHILHWTFLQHENVLKYLNYLMGRIISSREVLDLYLLDDKFPDPLLPLHPLIVDALSVIETLDPENSIKHDIYGNGPLWIFGALSTCAPDLRVVSYLLDVVLPRFRPFGSCGPLLETIIQETQIITCIKSEIERGRLTFLCDPDVVLTDDFALDEESMVYTKMAVVGRHRQGFHRDVVAVD
ncbi:hypothetical protein DER44DRAFT_901055 [Fusarium oxysporum]|nr:hypothetical protein DER44DRAFT_901055 [Fusarium oxysporum]